jgi:hypothetical protein
MLAVTAEPAHLRYARPLQPDATGAVCAVLDADVFAHAASRSADDLRVFAQDASGKGTETPFVLTESSSAPAETVPATVEDLGERDGAIVFDLAMPARLYSEVDLRLALKDFVGTADVTGFATNETGAGTRLGTWTIFDLTSQHLTRSTMLPLEESTFPRLHVVLRLSTSAGAKLKVEPGIVTGADIPPSRLAQTLYTPIAETTSVTQKDGTSVASFSIPAHVPIERATIVVDQNFLGNFLRDVRVTVGTEPNDEGVDGQISRANLKVGTTAIHQESLSVDAVLGANLRQSATVTVAVRNGNDKPLPIRAIRLEMRQRKVCFDAAAGSSYTLRYGDAALEAPVYDYGHFFHAEAAGTAALGHETINAQWSAREDQRPYTERHPEIIWIVLIAVVAVLGATAMGSVNQQRGHR